MIRRRRSSVSLFNDDDELREDRPWRQSSKKGPILSDSWYVHNQIIVFLAIRWVAFRVFMHYYLFGPRIFPCDCLILRSTHAAIPRLARHCNAFFVDLACCLEAYRDMRL